MIIASLYTLPHAFLISILLVIKNWLVRSAREFTSHAWLSAHFFSHFFIFSLYGPHTNRTALGRCVYVGLLVALPISPGGEVWEAYMEKTGGGYEEPCGGVQLCSSPENSRRTPWYAK